MFFHHHLGAGFKHVLVSPPTWGNDEMLTNLFQMGWLNHQLVMYCIYVLF